MVWCQFVVEVVVLVTTVIEPPGGYTRHAATAEAGGAAKTDGRAAAPFSSPAHSLAVSAVHSVSRILYTLLSPRLTLISHSRSALSVVTHRIVSSPAEPALPAPTLALLAPLCATPPMGRLTCSLALASRPFMALVASWSRIACSPAKPALPAPAPPPPFALFPHSPKGH